MDTKNWAKQLPEDVRGVLEAGIQVSSPAGAKGAAWSALAAKLPVVAGAGVAASASGGVLALLKPFAVGLALGVVATTTVVGVQSFTRPAEPTTLTSRPKPSIEQPVARGRSQQPVSPSARTPPALPAEAPAKRSAAAPVAASRASASSASSPPTTPIPAATTFAVEEPPSATEHAALIETRRVARARSLLQQGQANAVLLNLAELDRLAPHGVLIQERETLRIEALFALGDYERARTEARRFIARYPQSPHLPAVQRALR